MKQQMMTANRLLDGEVVYLCDDGTWSEDYSRARVVSDPAEVAEAQTIARDAEQAQTIVGAYLAKVGRADDGTLSLLSMKETIRATGPTTRRDLGKQARV